MSPRSNSLPLVDVCKALVYLHSEGFVHGDFKGDNVLVDNEHRACLADFGYAGSRSTRGIRGALSSGSVARGTTNYMAPELLVPRSNKDWPTLVDVYAFGMLIYEPFHGFHREVIKLYAVNCDRPRRPPWTLNHPIWDIVELCWGHEPVERPWLDYIRNILTSASMFPPLEWPSPPMTVSSPSIIYSSPWDLPTRTSATVFSDLPPATPRIPIAEPSLQPHHPPNPILLSFPPFLPTPTTSRHQLGGLKRPARRCQVTFQVNSKF